MGKKAETSFGRCFDCGAPADWSVFLAGEDEPLRLEAACEEHARGHWRTALLPSQSPSKPVRRARA